MYTTAYRDSILGVLDGTTLTSWSPYVGLFTAISDWRAGTVTEAAYTGYGTRPLASFGAPANTTPTGGRQIANDAVVTFPTCTAGPEDIIGWGLYPASTGGTVRMLSGMGADPPIAGTVDTADLITTQTAHGLVADQRVWALAAPGMGLATGLTENTLYYVLASGLTSTAFKVSTSSGGSAVDITAGGAALFIPVIPVSVAVSATPEFAASTLVVQI